MDDIIRSKGITEWDKCCLPEWSKNPDFVIVKMYQSLLTKHYKTVLHLCFIIKNRWVCKILS